MLTWFDGSSVWTWSFLSTKYKQDLIIIILIIWTVLIFDLVLVFVADLLKQVPSVWFLWESYPSMLNTIICYYLLIIYFLHINRHTHRYTHTLSHLSSDSFSHQSLLLLPAFLPLHLFPIILLWSLLLFLRENTTASQRPETPTSEWLTHHFRVKSFYDLFFFCFGWSEVSVSVVVVVVVAVAASVLLRISSTSSGPDGRRCRHLNQAAIPLQTDGHLLCLSVEISSSALRIW